MRIFADEDVAKRKSPMGSNQLPNPSLNAQLVAFAG